MAENIGMLKVVKQYADLAEKSKKVGLSPQESAEMTNLKRQIISVYFDEIILMASTASNKTIPEVLAADRVEAVKTYLKIKNCYKYIRAESNHIKSIIKLALKIEKSSYHGATLFSYSTNTIGLQINSRDPEIKSTGYFLGYGRSVHNSTFLVDDTSITYFKGTNKRLVSFERFYSDWCDFHKRPDSVFDWRIEKLFQFCDTTDSENSFEAFKTKILKIEDGIKQAGYKL